MVETAESELGLEKRCLACRQFWPADSEFFEPRRNWRNPLSQRCRACIAETYWGPAVASSMPRDADINSNKSGARP